jgi:hypothetical protein
VAAPSKAEAWGRLISGIAGSNTAEGMDVCLFGPYFALSCIGRGLCDGLITRPEESNCMINKPQYRGGQGSSMGCTAIGDKYIISSGHHALYVPSSCSRLFIEV